MAQNADTDKKSLDLIDGSIGGYSKSVVTDPALERKSVLLVTFAAFAAAAAYIVMVFIAFPLSIHTIINERNGCDPDVDDSCFAPVEESQNQYTLALTFLRNATALLGSLVGTLSDKYGRKPLLVAALFGYTLSSGFFLLGWNTRSIPMFFIGATILGMSSPVLPHGIAYISDISTPSRLAPNLGILQGIGYFGGLMTGGMLSLMISAATTGSGQNLAAYSSLFTNSYLAGFAFSGAAAVVVLFFVPESLHEDNRSKTIDLKKANPLGFLALVTRTGYFNLVFHSAFVAWISVGASEAVQGGWWLRRYAVTDTNVFIFYAVFVWIASGVGAVIMTKVYTSLLGLKMTLHVTMIQTVLTGLFVAFAPTVAATYWAIPMFFFASPAIPTLIALLMGQVGSSEKGALAGAIRSAEAAGKMMGIMTFGSAFAGYIAPFTPDISCIPDDYSSSNPDNTCECGVQGCPVLSFDDAGGLVATFVPSACSLGNLNQRVNGVTSKFVDASTSQGELRALPQTLIDLGAVERPDNCLGMGYGEGLGGFTTAVPRSYCYAEALAGAFVNQELGCPGFDISRLSSDVAFYICNATGAVNVDAGCTEGYFDTFTELASANYTPYHDPANLELYGTIAGRVFDPEWDEPVCEEFGAAELNICMVGQTVTDTPWLFPALYYGCLGLLSYSFFLFAETFFVSQDKLGWQEQSKDVAGDNVVVK